MSDLTILGLHIRETKNIGDASCHPLDYIDIRTDKTDRQISADMRRPPEDVRPDVVVLGGGAIAYQAPKIAALYPKALLVGWGIGFSKRVLEPVVNDDHANLKNGFALWGSRDFGTGLDYAPCASCMNPLFDDIAPPVHKAVVYGHAGARPLKDEAVALGLPYFDNTSKGGLEAALRHLGSGEIVITSSYHGAYWSTLLGRKVAMIPFGSKFFSLKHRPPAVETVAAGLKAAKPLKNALADCRADSLRFAARVRQVVRDRAYA